MLRPSGLAVAAAAACGGLTPQAQAGIAWPQDPGLERALGGRRGAIVAVDPQDGRILGSGGARERLREAAPPGSLAKLLTAYAALRAGRTDSSRRIPCMGSFGGRTCARAHGSLALDAALALSCNVHFMVLGSELGASPLQAAARDFGFGSPTGADPAESAGRVAPLESPIDFAYGAGSGLTATPLQIARAAAAIAGGGVVRALHTGHGPGKRAGTLDPAAVAAIRAGLREATSGAGTAGALASLGIPVAGKTGTAIFDAEADPPRWYGHFAGYAPGVAIAVRTEGRSARHDTVPVALAALRYLAEMRAEEREGRPREGAAHLNSRSPGEPATRVALFSAHAIQALDIGGDGIEVTSGATRRSLTGRIRLNAADPGITTVRPGAARVVVVRPVAATRRGRPDVPPARRIAGTVAVRTSGGRLLVVARIDLDTYAAAVAAAELGKAPPAALAAQAVLARSYALRHRDRHGAEGADLCDLTHCQLFQGDRRISREGRAALDAVSGAVLAGEGQPAEALFHAACGGRRASNEDVFGGEPLPYLRGGSDPWCLRSARAGAWASRLTWSELTRALAPDMAGDTVTDLRVIDRSPAGVPLHVEVSGRRRQVVLPSYQVWRDLGTELGWQRVRSVRFRTVRGPDGITFVGRGSGHAVGLCQAGAVAQAARGRSVRQILASYFPGTRIERPGEDGVLLSRGSVRGAVARLHDPGAEATP